VDLDMRDRSRCCGRLHSAAEVRMTSQPRGKCPLQLVPDAAVRRYGKMNDLVFRNGTTRACIPQRVIKIFANFDCVGNTTMRRMRDSNVRLGDHRNGNPSALSAPASSCARLNISQFKSGQISQCLEGDFGRPATFSQTDHTRPVGARYAP
jgi:hypothetical protein